MVVMKHCRDVDFKTLNTVPGMEGPLKKKFSYYYSLKLEQGSAQFFCILAGNKYFRHCG